MDTLYTRIKNFIFELFNKKTVSELQLVEDMNQLFTIKQNEFLSFIERSYFYVSERKSSPQKKLSIQIRHVKNSRKKKEELLLKEIQATIKERTQHNKVLNEAIKQAQTLVQNSIFGSKLFIDKSIIYSEKIKDKESLNYLTYAILDERVQRISGIIVKELQEGLPIELVNREIYYIDKIKTFVAIEIILQYNELLEEDLFLEKQIDIWYSYFIEEEKEIYRVRKHSAETQKNINKNTLNDSYSIETLKWAFSNLQRKEKEIILELYYRTFKKLLEEHKNQIDHLGEIVVEPLVIAMDELLSRLNKDIARHLENYANEERSKYFQEKSNKISIEQVSLESNSNYSQKALEDLDYLRDKVLK